MILSNLSKNNKGSGIAVVVYGVVVMMLLIFTAINILNAKIIENGYNSLRDAVLAASSGSVIHLLTTEDAGTTAQNKIIKEDDGSLKYDVYLQLALGYIINRSDNYTNTSVEGSEINNFIKLDHKKVVNSTMALLNDSVMRDKNEYINDSDKFKILMFFIEPLYDQDDYEKYFNIIYYTNKDCNENGKLIGNGTIDVAGGNIRGNSMEGIYENIQSRINEIVNDKSVFNETDADFTSFNINLNPSGGNLDELVRQMETVPYYLIIIKDFSLPTLFDDTQGNVFTFLSGDGKLKNPMCALNAGKTERVLIEN